MASASLCRYLTVLSYVCACVAVSDPLAVLDPLAFPPGFQFGAATAAYQIEGGWNASDKAPSIWDVYTHAAGGETGDVACDSYHLWREDVRVAKELGLHFYRFSISWSRLIPNSETFTISHEGWLYYDRLIDALLAEGIEPMVTLYHWDLPQALQDHGGWLNSTISDYFAKYALTAFILYGDRVKSWITLNEPLFFCNTGYASGLMAPGVSEPLGEYLCAKNAMLAHAKAWRIYDTQFRIKYGGRVSIANHAVWFEPIEIGHETIAHLAQQHTLGLYSHPIYSREGGWPTDLERALTFKNNTLHLLPEFSEAEKQLVQGTYDFYALNFYTSRLVRPARLGDEVVDNAFMGSGFLRLVYEMDPTWTRSNLDWFAMNPPGLRKQLNWIKDQYDNPEIMITENGFPSEQGLEDQTRIDAVHTHLIQAQLALEDGVRLTGYTYWSMMDNLEWHMGYGKRFGLVEVDFNATGRTRTMRRSAEYYRRLIRAQPRSSSSSFTPPPPSCSYLFTLLVSRAIFN